MTTIRFNTTLIFPTKIGELANINPLFILRVTEGSRLSLIASSGVLKHTGLAHHLDTKYVPRLD